jgi:hypothetical protein
MNSISEIIERASASIPAEASDHSSWARAILKALVPVVTQASLLTEESQCVQCSIAVVDFAAEYKWWDGFIFDSAIECSASNVMKLAGLTVAGETYLIARLVKGRLLIVGVGRPDPIVGMRMDPEIAFAILPQPELAFIAATILGPCTILLEGFRTELAFLFKGELQPPADLLQADLLQAANLTFISKKLTSKDVTLNYGGGPQWPVDALRGVSFLKVVKRLVQGAWFAGKGGILAFAAPIRRTATSAHWLFDSTSLLDLDLDVLAAQLEHNASRTPASWSHLQSVERAFSQSVLNVVRASTLDGAVLFDQRMRMRAFAAKLKSPSLKEFSIRHAADGPPLDLRMKGTRHRSAVSWVASGQFRMAVVISQDRVARIFGRDLQGDLVYLNARPSLFE